MAQQSKRRRSPSKPKISETAKLINFWNGQVSVPQNPDNEPLATRMIANYLSQRFWVGERNILVAGCGPRGRFLNMLPLGKPSRIVGVDFSPRAIKVMTDKFKNIEFVEADISELPFDDGEFDFTICIDTLSCIMDTDRFRDAIFELCRATTTDLLIIDQTTLSSVLQYKESNRTFRVRDFYIQFASVVGMGLSCVEEHYFGNPGHLDSRRTVLYYTRTAVLKENIPSSDEDRKGDQNGVDKT